MCMFANVMYFVGTEVLYVVCNWTEGRPFCQRRTAWNLLGAMLHSWGAAIRGSLVSGCKPNTFSIPQFIIL